MTKPEIAEKTFKDGFNCSQSVLQAYAGDLNLPGDLALKIANGFGGGMGRKQEVCGAVSGALMVIGLIHGRGRNDGKEKTEETYRKVQDFIDAFKMKHGTVSCKELLPGCRLLTDEGRKYFTDNNLTEKCRGFVRSSCEILEKILER
jgi:C_GCAxxG_C_C family probable redox protein